MKVYNDNIKSTKRYVHIQWDGLWDREKEEYLDWYRIEDLCNKTDFASQTWEKKYDKMKAENQLLKQKIEQLENLLRKHNLEGYR